jgi:hypothetical protein
VNRGEIVTAYEKLKDIMNTVFDQTQPLGRNRWAATVAPVDHAVARGFSINPFLKWFAFLIKLFLKKFV